MLTKKELPIRFACLLVTAIAGYSGATMAAEPIKFGLVGPLTGPAANTGLTVRATYELLAKQINDAGGIEIDGVKRPIEIIAADSQSKASVGVSAAQKLVTRDNVDVLVGDLLHSDVTLAIMELAPAFAKKPFYVPLPVSSSISQQIADAPDKYGNVWKWDGDSEAYAVSVANFLKDSEEKGLRSFPNKTVAFVAEETDYAQTNLASTTKELEKSGWKVIAKESVPIGHSDFFPQITKLRTMKPDVVVSIFTAANSGVAYMRQVKEQGFGAEQVSVYYGSLPGFQNGVGNAADGLVFFAPTFDARSERGRVFAELLKPAGINASGDAVLGYCSGQVLTDALKRAASLDIKKINQAFLATDDDTCPNYVRIVFDPKRHSPKLGPDGFFMTAAQILPGGKDYVVVWPEKAATGVLDKGLSIKE